MNFGSKPAEAALPVVTDLFQKSGAARFGLTLACFEEILEQVASKYSPEANSQQKQQLWRELRIEELVLARACSAGNDLAWVEFLNKYREKLYDIARGIAKEDSNARDLADSLYADLYGTSEKEGRRVSRLNFYMGRGSLEGWLRTLTEIGKIVGVHESTVSRRLEKLLKALRKQVLMGLQSRGMNRGQAEEALEADVRYLAVDVRRRLQESRSAAFQEDKGSD